MDDHFDVFISYAHQDKDDFVVPLIHALEARGLKVWFDAHQIEVGDDFRIEMDKGLARSRFGVAILSPSYQGYWSQAELSALFNQERIFGELKILPVLHRMTPVDIAATSPLTAARASVSSADGEDSVADEVFRRVRGHVSPRSGSVTTARSPLYGLPALPSQLFVGRDDVLAELTRLLGPSSVCLAASVEGLAGVGKTELALNLGHQLSQTSRFPGGVFWLDAESPDLTVQWGTTHADHLGIEARDIESRASLAVRRLGRQSTPLLVILDNVEEWTRDSRPHPLPEGPHVRQLITTRQRRLGGAQFQHVELGFLDGNASEELLQSLAGEARVSMPGWQELLDHLGGHALAIELAGAFLAESPGMTPKSYLALLSAGGESQAVADLVRYGRTVRQALEATWQRLDSEEKSSWCLAACFAPEKVLPPISNAVGLTPEKLMPLRRYHLIEEEEPAGAWRMHRLVRSFCGTREESVSAFKRFVKACDEFSKPYQWGDDPRWLTQHLAHLEQSSEDRDLAEYPPGLLRRLALLRVSLGDFACAQERLEHGLRLDFDQEDKTLFRVSLALVLQGQGDFPAARALLEETLKTVLHKHGEKHPKVAMCRSNLGTVLKNQGDLTGARVLLEKALADYLDSLGEKHPSVAVCRSNLATVLQDQGDLPGARELLEKALAADLEVYGEKHPTVAIRRSNLATVLEDQGDLTGAKDLLEKALAVDLEIHGKRHPKVAIRKGLLGRVLAAQGLLNRAKSFSEEALQTFENTLGADHPYCETARRDLEEILNQMRG